MKLRENIETCCKSKLWVESWIGHGKSTIALHLLESRLSKTSCDWLDRWQKDIQQSDDVVQMKIQGRREMRNQLSDIDMVLTTSIDQYIIQKRDDANLSVEGFVKKFKEDYPEYPKIYARILAQELKNNEKLFVLFQDLFSDKEHAKRVAPLEPNGASQRSVKSRESLDSCLGKTLDEVEQLGFCVAYYIKEPPLVGAALQITANSPGVIDTCDSRECYFDHGRIRTDYWWDACGITIRWQARLSEPSTIYVLLRDENGVVISQLPLGEKVEDERTFTTEFIGFDPSQTKWSLSVILI